MAVPLACAAAGLLATTSMVNARGTDLRGGRYSDLTQLVQAQSNKVLALREETAALQQRIDALTGQVGGQRVRALQRDIAAVSPAAGLHGLGGPGLVVTLADAPRDQEVPDGIDPNLLIVHQQDIQAVVNAMWAGGAEGISLQGQRIIATTGIKCVGNTVVLQGVPYSPPYRVVAVGDPRVMYDALAASPEVANYRDYTEPPYNLGWLLQPQTAIRVPAFKAPVKLDYAKPTE
ncbi:MAG: DUF881 domain-containing protein [Propionibacteriales bacterium]|nr:DUF881 domain-containing protein [Propionibacteriales bacterium]